MTEHGRHLGLDQFQEDGEAFGPVQAGEPPGQLPAARRLGLGAEGAGGTAGSAGQTAQQGRNVVAPGPQHRP
ncbi:hypothetical protein ABZ825_41285, partial [Streptomyces tauricus]